MVGDIEFRIADCLAQIDMQDRRVNAWEHVDAEGALTRARELDSHPENRRGPLYGLALGVKDIIDVAGMPTRCGSIIYKDNVARIDATAVALARNAGAVIIGKTVTTELATMVPSRTKNPQHFDHTPGGSSSGSAAAVAAGMLPLAMGTQTAGSVIRPAAYCGVVGFKPSFGLVPRGGIKIQSESLDTVGVFSRTIEDAARWYSAMTGSTSWTPAPTVTEAVAQTSKTRSLRINFITNFAEHADIDMVVALAEVAEALGSHGVRVREVRLPAMFDSVNSDQRIVQLAENARHYAIEHKQFRQDIHPTILAALDEGATISADSYLAARERLAVLRKQTDLLFADCDGWMLPSAPGAAPKGFETTGDPIFNRMATALYLPALNLPICRNKNRMPLGVQLIGARHQDEKCFSTAERIIALVRGVTDVNA